MSHRLNNLTAGDSVFVAWVQAGEFYKEQFTIDEIQPMYGGFPVESITAIEESLDLPTDAEFGLGTIDFKISNADRTMWLNEGFPNSRTYFIADTDSAEARFDASAPCFHTLGVAETLPELAWNATIKLILYDYEPVVALDFAAHHIAPISEWEYAQIRKPSLRGHSDSSTAVLEDRTH